jgi:hypothetical protein
MRRVHRSVEVGGRVAGQVRVVFEVEHTARVTAALASAGSEIFAPPTRTRWNSLHVRLTALAGWGKPSSSDEPHRCAAAWHGSWHEMTSTRVDWWGWWGTQCGHSFR